MTVKRSAVLLNTDAHRPARDAFVSHLNRIISREGLRAYEAIDRWLDAGFRAMRGCFLHGDAFDKNEAEYLRIIRQFRRPDETAKDFAAMLGALVMALDAEPVDFVGPLFGEFAAAKSLGQFFTPWHVSRLMAETIIGDPRQMLADAGRGYITLQEPACGVGGMVLAASAVLRDRGMDLARECHWTAVDIDYSATCAAYLQISLCGISADVIHGNTLSLQTWLATPTLAAVLHPKRQPNPGCQPTAAAPQAPPLLPAVRPAQMTFDFLSRTADELDQAGGEP